MKLQDTRNQTSAILKRTHLTSNFLQSGGDSECIVTQLHSEFQNRKKNEISTSYETLQTLQMHMFFIYAKANEKKHATSNKPLSQLLLRHQILAAI